VKTKVSNVDEVIAGDCKCYLSSHAVSDSDAVYQSQKSAPSPNRAPFAADRDKIIYDPLYARLADKTQVFSLVDNDDITRRILHVQYVSAIARNVGRRLGLNEDLIEAIALGHDIGHSPFGHRGEDHLNDLLLESTGLHFQHNVQAVRFLHSLKQRSLSLQTLDGILCHNGEELLQVYEPNRGDVQSFDDLENLLDGLQRGEVSASTLRASTLEGCLVRICDVIAYVGKDRSDAQFEAPIKVESHQTSLGNNNPKILSSLLDDIVAGSTEGYIALSDEKFHELTKMKDANGRDIYFNEKIVNIDDALILRAFETVFKGISSDIESQNEDSFVFPHFLQHPFYRNFFENTLNLPSGLIAADFIASMSEGYFLHAVKFYDKELAAEIEEGRVPYF